MAYEVGSGGSGLSNNPVNNSGSRPRISGRIGGIAREIKKEKPTEAPSNPVNPGRIIRSVTAKTYSGPIAGQIGITSGGGGGSGASGLKKSKEINYQEWERLEQERLLAEERAKKEEMERQAEELRKGNNPAPKAEEPEQTQPVSYTAPSDTKSVLRIDQQAEEPEEPLVPTTIPPRQTLQPETIYTQPKVTEPEEITPATGAPESPNPFYPDIAPNQEVGASNESIRKGAQRTPEEEEEEFWTGGNPLREEIDRLNSGNLKTTDVTRGRPVPLGVTVPNPVRQDVDPTLLANNAYGTSAPELGNVEDYLGNVSTAGASVSDEQARNYLAGAGKYLLPGINPVLGALYNVRPQLADNLLQAQYVLAPKAIAGGIKSVLDNGADAGPGVGKEQVVDALTWQLNNQDYMPGGENYPETQETPETTNPVNPSQTGAAPERSPEAQMMAEAERSAQELGFDPRSPEYNDAVEYYLRQNILGETRQDYGNYVGQYVDTNPVQPSLSYEALARNYDNVGSDIAKDNILAGLNPDDARITDDIYNRLPDDWSPGEKEDYIRNNIMDTNGYNHFDWEAATAGYLPDNISLPHLGPYGDYNEAMYAIMNGQLTPEQILSLYVNPNAGTDGSTWRGMEWINDLPEAERAGMMELLANFVGGGDPYRERGEGFEHEFADMTEAEYEKLADLFMKNMPALAYLLQEGYLNSLDQYGNVISGEKAIRNFFFKDLNDDGSGTGSGKKGYGTYNRRSWGGRSWGGRGWHRYGGGGGSGSGTTYYTAPSSSYAPSNRSGSGYSGGSGGGYGSSGISTARSAEPSETNQRQNRVYNIMKNWSF